MQKGRVDKVYQNHLCSGCGACSVICAHDAISFQRDSIGQMQPIIDQSRCTNCGRCLEVCPGIDIRGVFTPKDSQEAVQLIAGSYEKVYVGKSLSDDIYRNSQSGGVVTSLLSYLFQSGLIDVALVARQSNTLPQFAVVTSEKELAGTQKSQYVSFDLLSGLKETAAFSSVAVVGLPCHLEGIFLLQSANSVFVRNVKYKIGLICGGSFPSTMSDVILKMSGCRDRKYAELIWRSKKSGNYKNADIEISSTQTEKSEFLSRQIRHNGKHLLTSPRCRLCYDKLNICADIVLGDPWGMSEIDERSGNNVILVRNKIGTLLLSEAASRNFVAIKEADFCEFVRGQGIENKLSYTIESLKIYTRKNWLKPGWSAAFENKKSVRKHGELFSEVSRFVSLSQKSENKIASYVREKISLQLLKDRIRRLLSESARKDNGMVIQIDGGSSTNKGAQLMLHACLLEIHNKYPNAEVYINNDKADIKQLSELYRLNIRKRQPNWWRKCVSKLRLLAVCNKLFPRVAWVFSLKVPFKGVDVLLNIGGFQFGDQWHHNKIGNRDWRRYISRMKAFGTRIIFMPQAFGPFKSKGSVEICRVLDSCADVLMARDGVSMEYLRRQGLKRADVVEFPDFTASIAGRRSNDNGLKGCVCFIPNSKMIVQGIIDKDQYVNAFARMIEYVSDSGKKCFLLNHEGRGDLRLCGEIRSKLSFNIPIVEKTDALSTKGVIADSYLVVSSRFHGVANALNTSVPCLATSWSHKYQMLFESYGFVDNILDLTDFESVKNKLDNYLNPENNANVRLSLNESVAIVRQKNERMWAYIWNH